MPVYSDWIYQLYVKELLEKSRKQHVNSRNLIFINKQKGDPK
jgi:hypothetical protein